MVATWYGDDIPHLSWKCAQVTGKAGENGQYSGAGRQLTLDKTVGSRAWRRTRGLSKFRLDQWWGSSSKTAPGSLRLGHRLVSLLCTETAECTVRPTKGQVSAAAPYPSVAVRDRGHGKGVAGSGCAR